MKHKKQKRWSMVQKVAATLVITLLLCSCGGLFSLYRLEQYNLEYIYELIGELIDSSIENLEDNLDSIQTILYNVVLSDDVQNAAGNLLEAEQEGTVSGSEKNSSYNTITDCIQKNIRSDNSIVCASFFDRSNSCRSIAMTHYYQLSEEDAGTVIDEAVAASGSIILLDGTEMTGAENVLIMAMEIKEKKNLSLTHLGVIVFFVDLDTLGTELTESHDGIYVLGDIEKNYYYVLNDEEGVLDSATITVPGQNGFHVEKICGEAYFLVERTQAYDTFSYVVLTNYAELFNGTQSTYRFYMILLIISSALALIAGMVFAQWITKDIRQFIHYIQRVPDANSDQLPLYEKEVHDRDAYELKSAFNQMSHNFNELIRDNYANQLLIKETQLQALQSQMNPHFLYNALNSVYWMVKTAGHKNAAEMISSLSIMLKETISNQEFLITVEKEISIVSHYFVIQKYRYEDRLNVSIDLADDCRSLQIPKFTIQPLAENAINYGLEQMLEPCTIEVRVYREEPVPPSIREEADGEAEPEMSFSLRQADGETGSGMSPVQNPTDGQTESKKKNAPERALDYICEVRNNGPEPEEKLMEKLRSGTLLPRGNGIGLLNIEKRVRSVFGEEYGIRIFREGKFTVVQVRMRQVPLEENKDSGRQG
ncbi:MAG: histidine kinase [Lachnospiraceae bacterium]|nr:histidine kinase [Lachnospiraceae bacterium]